MKWLRFGTNLKISRVLFSLLLLAFFKLAVMGFMAVDSMTLALVKAVAPEEVTRAMEQSLPAVAQAAEGDEAAPDSPDDNPADVPTPIADAADSAANRQEAQETQLDAAAEEVQIEEDLPQEWQALKRKEEMLAQRERTLMDMESSIRAEAVRVEKMHAEIRQMLEEAQGIKDKRVKQLVDMLSNTKAKKAAEILQTMDTDLAVKVLSGMRGRQSGEILSFVEAKKAAELSEKLTQLQIPFIGQ